MPEKKGSWWQIQIRLKVVSGHGLKARYGDHTILIGNRKLMVDNNIPVTETKESKSKFEIQGKAVVCCN